MNLLGNNGFDKKKWLTIIGGVVAVGLLIFALLMPSQLNKNDPNAEDNPNSHDPSGDNYGDASGWRVDYEFTNETDDLTNNDPVESVRLPEPTTSFGGTLVSYTDNSVSADITVNVGGNEATQKTFQLRVGSIVFDAEKNTVLIPSQLASYGDSQSRLIVNGTANENNQQATVIIVNDKLDLEYSEVTKVENTSDKTVLVAGYSNTHFVVPSDVTIYNALTGVPYERDKFKAGDRIFAYTSEGTQGYTLPEEEIVRAVGTTKLYVYPAAE